MSLVTHFGLQLKNGSYMVKCHMARRPDSRASWTRTAEEFEALPVEQQCKHCVKHVAAYRKGQAQKVAQAAREAADK